jgi:hypothetical protein
MHTCHSAQNPMSFRLILKNKKIKIYETIILPVDLYLYVYMYEISFLAARGEHGLKVLENVEMRIFGSTRGDVTEGASGLALVIKYY